MTENGNGNGLIMPVQPMYGNGGGMGGGFGWGSDIWLILIVLFALGGWGGGFGGGFGGGYGNMMLGYDFPWHLNGQQGINNNVSDGFRDQMLQTTISSTNDRLANLSTQLCDCCGNISTQLCNGFNGVNMSVNTAQNAIAQQLYGNQIATLQGFNGVQTQIAQASADNRLGIANLGSDIAREACADRQAVNEGVRDILANQTAGIQRILDKLCDQELQAERRDNANLRSELMYARGQASQIEQTAQILANNNAQTALFQQGLNNEVDALYNRLNNCPVATVPVYGRQPIFSCNNNGCGCNNGFIN